MKERLLQKIQNPAVRKELKTLFNNGFNLKEEHFRDFISEDLESNLVQVFPTVNENMIVDNINLDFSKARNLFVIVRADEGLYWKAIELVKYLSESAEAGIVWNFQSSEDTQNIMKIITISY